MTIIQLLWVLLLSLSNCSVIPILISSLACNWNPMLRKSRTLRFYYYSFILFVLLFQLLLKTIAIEMAIVIVIVIVLVLFHFFLNFIFSPDVQCSPARCVQPPQAEQCEGHHSRSPPHCNQGSKIPQNSNHRRFRHPTQLWQPRQVQGCFPSRKEGTTKAHWPRHQNCFWGDKGGWFFVDFLDHAFFWTTPSLKYWLFIISSLLCFSHHNLHLCCRSSHFWLLFYLF